jgi:YfiH family protein
MENDNVDKISHTPDGDSWIIPHWPAPSNVKACMTTRLGGVSAGPYSSLNLGDHVGDDSQNVALNRQRLSALLDLPSPPVWLNQVHGTGIVELPLGGSPSSPDAGDIPRSDGSFSRQIHQVCTVMTADCLPVLLCDTQGTVVAAAHAGWRGLAAGVLENTIQAMAVAPKSLLAWLGPAIGPDAFEVGHDVVTAFTETQPEARNAFRPISADHWLADIYALARLRLRQAGVTQLSGGGYCTYRESQRFYSYRRDKITGRMAALIWLAA